MKMTFIAFTLAAIFGASQADAAFSKITVIGKITNFTGDVVRVATKTGEVKVPRKSLERPDEVRPGQDVRAHISAVQFFELNSPKTN